MNDIYDVNVGKCVPAISVHVPKTEQVVLGVNNFVSVGCRPPQFSTYFVNEVAV